MGELDELCDQLTAGLVIKDRKWMLKTFPRCFVGSECVDALLTQGHAMSRDDAVSLGQSLLAAGLIHHVTKDHSFKDEKLFYRFKRDEKQKDRTEKPGGSMDLGSWKNLLSGPEESPENSGLQPDIPHGFVEADEMATLLAEVPVSPLDEHNAFLLDNVRPADWRDPAASDMYNMVAIGAGAGGLVTAAGAAGVGARVAIIEKNMLGGDCLNYGCVPSKALLRTAKAVSEIKHAADLGIHVGEVTVDFPAVMERMRKLRASISPNDSAKKFEDLGIDVFIGEAKFISRNEVEVNGQTLRFARACIATGGRAAVPPILGLDKTPYLTNETIFNLVELPQSMVIIGAGAIGCEMAQSFACFGTEVTLMCRSDRILAREEEEAALIVEAALRADGVQILTNVTYREFLCHPASGTTTVKFMVGPQYREVTVSKVLLAVGRSPNVAGLGLDAAGVEYDVRTGVHVNNQLMTSNKNIFAVGDCCTKYKFTHVADFMARIVIRNALFFGSSKFSDLVIPWATYTKPELAHVGLYEADMQKRNLEYDVYQKNFEDVDRAILDSDKGYIKVLTAKGSDRIVGCTIVGARAGDMISEVTLAMTNKIGLGAIAVTIHPYPTVSESIRQVGDLYNRTRLTPTVKLLFRNLLAARRSGKI